MVNKSETERKEKRKDECEEKDESGPKERNENKHEEEHLAIDSFHFIGEEDETYFFAEEGFNLSFNGSWSGSGADIAASIDKEISSGLEVEEEEEAGTLRNVGKSPDDVVKMDEGDLGCYTRSKDEINHREVKKKENKNNGACFLDQDDEEMGNQKKICDEKRDEIMTGTLKNAKKDPSEEVNVIVQADLEIGIVPEAGAAASSFDVDADTPPHRKRKIWENLPVATPVFDAEVVTWDFDRPEYKSRFGLGFRDPEDKKETKSNEPIFTDKDRANVFRLIGKVVGIILALPLYFIYWLLTFRWISPLLCVVDTVFAKPTGLVIDCILYCTATAAWFFYNWVLIPLYKCTLVYPARAARNFMLVSAKLFLMVIDWIINSFIATVEYLISTRCCQYILKSLAVMSKWMYNNLILTPINFVVSIPSLIVAYILRPVFNYVLKPFWQGMLNVVLFAWSVLSSIAGFVKNSMLLPCYQLIRTGIIWTYKNTVLRLYGGIVLSLKWIHCSILQPFWSGFVSGLSFMYKHVLEPIGKGFMILWRFLVASVLAFRDGFVSGLSCMYKHVLKPVGKGIMILWRFLFASALFVHNTILVPIGRVVSTFFRTLYCYTIVPLKRIILLVTSFMTEVFKSIGAFISNVFKSTGSFIGQVGKYILALFGG